MEENRVFWAITHDGRKYNVEAGNIIEAAEKIKRSCDIGELKPEDVFIIIDIPG